MGKFRVEIEQLAEDHLRKHYKAGNKATIKRISAIIKELSEHPYTGTGKPEQLKHELSGYWSRRINRKDRLIYKVEEDIVLVLVVSAMGNYERSHKYPQSPTKH
jgi:toxin YoeB